MMSLCLIIPSPPLFIELLSASQVSLQLINYCKGIEIGRVSGEEFPQVFIEYQALPVQLCKVPLPCVGQ
jgi:hypothetical protein